MFRLFFCNLMVVCLVYLALSVVIEPMRVATVPVVVTWVVALIVWLIADTAADRRRGIR